MLHSVRLQDEASAATVLPAADGTSVAAIRGLTVLADAALPPTMALLPPELSDTLPDRSAPCDCWPVRHPALSVMARCDLAPVGGCLASQADFGGSFVF